MDAWFESVVLAMAVIAVGIAALGTRFETWHPAQAHTVAAAMRCVPLHADASDHQPKCATAVSIEDPEAPSTPQRLVRN